MTPVFNKTEHLLTNQPSGVTGSYVATSEGRAFSILSYGSGVDANSAIIFSCPSPFFDYQTMPFLSIPITGNGYNNTYYMQSPVAELQASLSGNGHVWVALVIRD